MSLLFLDTSDHYLKLAIVKDGLDLIFEKTELNQFDEFHVYLNRLMTRNRLKCRDLKQILVNRGPGSFMGVRLGVIVAKTLAYLNRSCLYGMDSFHPMEHALKRDRHYDRDGFYLMVKPFLKSNFMATVLQDHRRETSIFKLEMKQADLIELIKTKDRLVDHLNKILGREMMVSKDLKGTVGYLEDFEEEIDHFIPIDYNRKLIEDFFNQNSSPWKQQNQEDVYALKPIYL